MSLYVSHHVIGARSHGTTCKIKSTASAHLSMHVEPVHSRLFSWRELVAPQLIFCFQLFQTHLHLK